MIRKVGREKERRVPALPLRFKKRTTPLLAQPRMLALGDSDEGDQDSGLMVISVPGSM
jgi:hypothetical protein